MSGRSDRILEPGARDFVSGTMYTTGRTGRVVKTIKVTTNDPAHRKVVLTCNGQVKSAFSGPAQRIDFGRIERRAGPQTKTITLVRGVPDRVTPKLLPVEHDRVKATLREVEPGRQYQLAVTIGPPWPNGDLRTVLQLETGIPGAPQEYVHVSADIAPRLRVKPEWFTIPRELPAASDYKVEVLWEGKPAKLLSAEVTDPALAVRIEQADDQQRLVLRVPTGYKRGSPPPEVKVHTDDQDVADFTVQVRYDRPKRARPRPAPKSVHLKKRALPKD